jgi:hypothetical protein
MNEETTGKQPWERMTGETSRWFQRFEAFRLKGVGRSLLGIANEERVAKGQRESHYTPGSWRNAARAWDWQARAEAWDQHLTDQKIAAIQAAEAAWVAKIMGPNETLARISEHSRNDLREFFKISDRWTEHPLPTEEVMGEEEREVKVGEEYELRTFYRVKSVVLDLEALLDPAKSHRVKKFGDSPKNGVTIELYNADDAAELMAKHHKLLTDTVDVNMYANTKGYIGVSPDDWDEADPPDPPGADDSAQTEP